MTETLNKSSTGQLQNSTGTVRADIQPYSEQGQLLFDFAIPKPKERPPVPPFREKEKNDNDHLMNIQYRYLTGEKQALSEFYLYSCKVCTKFIKDERRKKGFFISDEDREEKAHNAATYLIKQYLTRSDFLCSRNITSYLFQRVLHELYYHTKIDEIIEYCDNEQLLRNKTE